MTLKKNKTKHKTNAKASSKISNTNKVHVEIHHHHKKRGKKSESTPPKTQYIPMGGPTIVNNIPSQNDAMQIQLMGSYMNMMKNLESEMMAMKMTSTNHDVIDANVQAIKTNIDNTVKPKVTLELASLQGNDREGGPLSGSDWERLNKSSFIESVADEPQMYNNSQYRGFSDLTSVSSYGPTKEFMDQFTSTDPPERPRRELGPSIVSQDTRRYYDRRPSTKAMSENISQVYAYTPTPLDIANAEVSRIATYDMYDSKRTEAMRNSLTFNAIKDYAQTTKFRDQELKDMLNTQPAQRSGRGGFYGPFEAKASELLDAANNKAFNNDVGLMYD